MVTATYLIAILLYTVYNNINFTAVHSRCTNIIPVGYIIGSCRAVYIILLTIGHNIPYKPTVYCSGRGSAQQIEDTQLTILDSEAKSWYKDGHRTNSQEMAPSKAYDGDYSTFYSVKDGDADGNFLKLHLQMVYLITRVKVTNRLDGCCAQRILDTVIKVQVEVGGSVRDTGTCGTIAGN